MYFRTSPNGGYPGFAANIICFQPAVADDSTCSTTARTSSNTRKRQLLDNFVEQMRQHAELVYHQRRRRQAVPVGLALGRARTMGTDWTPKFRFLRFEIPPEEDVTYHHRILTVSTRSKSRVGDIDALYVFRSTEKTKVYRIGAAGYGVTLHFFGPGALNIVGRRAFYRIYIPSDFTLTKEEHSVLTELIAPHLAMAREIARKQPQNTSQELNSSQDPTRTIIQQAGPSLSSPLTFHNQEVLLALDHENDCNPVLRASARSIVEDTQEKVPDHLEILRRVLQASLSAPNPSKKAFVALLQSSSLSRAST